MQAAFPTRGENAAALFGEIPCLRGVVEAGLHGRGRIWADSPICLHGAVMAVGDFLICGGKAGPSAARLLRTAMASEERDWLVYAPGPWRGALERTGSYRWTERWAFDHYVQPEDSHLRRLLAACPEELAFQPIEAKWVDLCRSEAWSRDFVHEFADAADYAAHGLGVLLVQRGQAVAGASSYVAYPGGIEIQVQTREGCEGMGFATLASARLILMAHARGLIATWDAGNAVSAHIARKLGYRDAGLYHVAEKA